MYSSSRRLGRVRSRWGLGWWLVIAGAGTLAGVALMAVLALPRVTALAPAPGAVNVASHASIKVTFNRPMNQDSVAEAFHLTPPISGTLTWKDQTLLFIPAAPWPEKSSITVTLNTLLLKRFKPSGYRGGRAQPGTGEFKPGLTPAVAGTD